MLLIEKSIKANIFWKVFWIIGNFGIEFRSNFDDEYYTRPLYYQNLFYEFSSFVL